MAMDDTYRLVQAVLMDGWMTRPLTSDPLKGPWQEAEVLDAAVVGDHHNGKFNGYARYVIKGEEYAQQQTFHDLWTSGWTTFEYREQVLARPRSRKRTVKRKSV